MCDRSGEFQQSQTSGGYHHFALLLRSTIPRGGFFLAAAIMRQSFVVVVEQFRQLFCGNILKGRHLDFGLSEICRILSGLSDTND
jgi:hypothetical protein